MSTITVGLFIHHIPESKRTMSSSSRKSKDLQVIEPLPVADDRTPLLHRHSNGDACEEQDSEALEEQARQERREHDVGFVPVADELSTRRLVVTMGSMWLSTFFAALGTLSFWLECWRFGELEFWNLEVSVDGWAWILDMEFEADVRVIY
jgi:hypothetical protein